MLVTRAALLVFHIPFRGNFLLLLGLRVLFLMTTLGVGLFISTISHTQQQAMMSSLLLHRAGVHAERVHVSGAQYAAAGADWSRM